MFKNLIGLVLICLFLISCGGGGGGSSAGGTTPGSTVPQRVVSFTVSTGASVAKASWFDFFLKPAYAAGGANKKKITYNTDDKISVVEFVGAGEVVDLYNQFTYDSDGNISKEERYVLDDVDENGNGRTDDYIKYVQRDFTYYSDNTLKNIVTTNYVRATGAVSSTTTSTYTKNPDGTLTVVLGTLTKIYYYDADGKITKTTSTDGGLSPRETQFTYDSKGRCIKEKNIQKWDDSVASEYDYTYTDDDLVKTKDNGTTMDTYDYTKENGTTEGEDAVSILTYGSVDIFGK